MILFNDLFPVDEVAFSGFESLKVYQIFFDECLLTSVKKIQIAAQNLKMSST